MAEARGQSSVRAKRPRLDRPEGHTETFGDLRMRESLKMIELEELAFIGALDVEWLGNKCGLGRPGVVETIVFSPLLAPMDIDRNTSSNSGKPRSELSARIEGSRGAPCLHERLLRRVLGQVPIAQRTMRDAVYQPPVLAIDGAHRVGVALTKSLEGLGFHGHQCRRVIGRAWASSAS
jgi:hypothetical protein